MNSQSAISLQRLVWHGHADKLFSAARQIQARFMPERIPGHDTRLRNVRLRLATGTNMVWQNTKNWMPSDEATCGENTWSIGDIDQFCGVHTKRSTLSIFSSHQKSPIRLVSTWPRRNHCKQYQHSHGSHDVQSSHPVRPRSVIRLFFSLLFPHMWRFSFHLHLTSRLLVCAALI